MTCKTCGGKNGNHVPSLLDKDGVGAAGHKILGGTDPDTQFDQDDLANLRGVLSIKRSEVAAYNLEDGSPRSMFQRKEIGYYVTVKGDTKQHMFVFAEYNHELVFHSHRDTPDDALPEPPLEGKVQRLYKVEACLMTVGYYGDLVVATSKKEAVDKAREKYKHLMIAEYKAKCLGIYTEPIK